MGRGQYDRSLTKEQRAALKLAAEIKTGKTPKIAAAGKTEKKARAPWGSKSRKASPVAAESVGATGKVEKHEGNAKQHYGISIMELASLRGAFTGNIPNTKIVEKLDLLISRGLDSAIQASAPAEPVKAAPVPVASAPVQAAPVPVASAPVQAAAPVVQMPAPVQFNPTSPNGAA